MKKVLFALVALSIAQLAMLPSLLAQSEGDRRCRSCYHTSTGGGGFIATVEGEEWHTNHWDWIADFTDPNGQCNVAAAECSVWAQYSGGGDDEEPDPQT